MSVTNYGGKHTVDEGLLVRLLDAAKLQEPHAEHKIYPCDAGTVEVYDNPPFGPSVYLQLDENISIDLLHSLCANYFFDASEAPRIRKTPTFLSAGPDNARHLTCSIEGRNNGIIYHSEEAAEIIAEYLNQMAEQEKNAL